MRPDDDPPRLPRWTLAVIVLGGVLTYVAVGVLLQGVRFVPDLQRLLEDPGAFVQGGPEAVAPFVLLFIPAVLGALGTRGMLRVLVAGLRRGDPPATIAKALAMYLGSLLVLVVVAWSSSGRTPD
jgi:hypothetical protein